MLSGIVHNFGSQVRSSPGPQSSREKNEQRTGCDHKSGEHWRLWFTAHDRWSNQMPQRGDERNMVKGGKAKPGKINCADDPEPSFELEPGRAHHHICSGGCD